MGDGGSGRRAGDRIRESSIRLREEYNRAQQVLGKAEGESISDIEAANARAQGLISDTQEAFITRLNQTQLGAIETLRQQDIRSQELAKQAETDIVDNILATSILSSSNLKSQFGEADLGAIKAEADILSSLVESGIVERESLTESTLQAFKDISGFNERSFQALEPFAEQGRRSLLQSQVLGGTATQEEREQFESEFGPIAISPVAQERIKEQERATQRLQNALGNRFSGLGISEVLEKGSQRITGEEFQRQQELAFRGGQLGLQAASQQAQLFGQAGQVTGNLRASLGENLAGSFRNQNLTGVQATTQFRTQRSSFKTQLGRALADNLQRQQQLKAQAQQAFRARGIDLSQQLGQDVSNVQTGTGQLQAGGIQDFGNLGAGIVQQGGAQTAAVRTLTGGNIANLITQGAQESAGLDVKGFKQIAESEGSLLKDIGGAAGQIGGAIIGGSLLGPLGAVAGAKKGQTVTNFLA